MTIGQVFNAYNGYHEQEADRAKASKIIAWETIRWQTFILYNLHVMKKDRLSNSKQLIKFEWDEKPEAPDPEKMKEINDSFPDTIKHGIR